MGTASYTDAWSVGQGKPLTEDRRPVGAASSGEESSVDHPSPNASHLTAWAEEAFGPAFTNLTRELGEVARKLTGPGQLRHPWAWIGAAGLLGYALGRSGILRPVASFTVKTALATLVERALRG
jgi:hypothetical protein